MFLLLRILTTLLQYRINFHYTALPGTAQNDSQFSKSFKIPCSVSLLCVNLKCTGKVNLWKGRSFHHDRMTLGKLR